MKLLSVVVPCYNEEENVSYFYEELMKQEAALKERDIRLELIYVDDGVHLVSFSRNFGKEAGIYAGLKKAAGDYVVLMDADLQDPPSLLPEMLHYLEEEGYDSVATRRVTRKGEPVIRSFFARRFYRLMKRISHTEIVDGARDYRLMKRPVVDAILSMTESLAGWDFGRNGWNMKISNGQRARQSGISGSFFCTPWMGFWLFPRCRLLLYRFWVLFSVYWLSSSFYLRLSGQPYLEIPHRAGHLSYVLFP